MDLGFFFVVNLIAMNIEENYVNNAPVKINKKYDGKIDKLIYYNSNTKHAKWDHISRLNVKKSYIHILKQ